MLTKFILVRIGYKKLNQRFTSLVEKVCHMSDDTLNSNRIKFDRVNEQLNYKRRFISLNKAEVTIPNIPYEGFDVYSPDTKVKPWSLLELIISARIFTQWPASKASNPDDSFLEAHKLLSVPNQAIVFVGLNLSISKEFHAHKTQKFPLVIHQELINVGKSSARKLYTLSNPNTRKALVHCYFDDVLINQTTRTGVPFPEWWREKYSFVNDFNEKPVKVKPHPGNNIPAAENTFRVEFDDLDHNLHATSSSYLRYSLNAAFSNIIKSKYQRVNMDCFNAGIKSVSIQFLKEAVHGEELLVKSWENLVEINTLHFSIIKPSQDDKQYCYVKCEFYDVKDIKCAL